jgi:hypothetical protein
VPVCGLPGEKSHGRGGAAAAVNPRINRAPCAGAGANATMLLLAMISLLVGAVLAQRFKIMILIPAIGIMLVAAVGAGVTQAHIVWWTILMIAAAGASMQVGYVIGLGIRHILEAPTERAEAIRRGTSARQDLQGMK